MQDWQVYFIIYLWWYIEPLNTSSLKSTFAGGFCVAYGLLCKERLPAVEMVSLTSVPHIEMYFGKWIHTFKADMAGSSLFKASEAEIFQTKLKIIIMCTTTK